MALLTGGNFFQATERWQAILLRQFHCGCQYLPNFTILNAQRSPVNCKLLLAALLLTVSARAQETLYRSYPFNPLAVNPAYAGSREVTSMTGILRRRSLVLQNTYTSQLFSIDFPIAQERAGLGFQAFNDNYNPSGTLGLYGSFAYRFKLTETGTLALGLQAGFTQVVPFNQFVGNNQYPFMAGLGIFYRTNRWYAGLAAQNLVGRADSYGIQRRPVFLTAGYVFDLSEDFKLRAGTLVQAVNQLGARGTDVAVDLNATVWYHKIGVGLFWQGTGSEQNNRALLGTAEAQIGDRLRFGISYDFAAGRNANQTQPIGSTASASIFQLMLRYEFDNGRGKVGRMRYF